MTVFYEIVLPVVLLIATGYAAARTRLLGEAVVKALSDGTFALFLPALLFGAMVRVDLDALSFDAAKAYYPAGALLFAAVLWTQRSRGREAAVGVVQALAAIFGNTVMLGIPLVKLAYGETGLALLLTIIALHALVFLTLGTVIIEFGRALSGGAAAGGSSLRALGPVLLPVARSAVIHPVVLPILAGLAWSAAGLGLPLPLDKALGMLGTAAVPICLVLLGASLAQFDLRADLRAASALVFLKSAVHPLLAWSIGRFVFALDPLALAVATVTAALPTGANIYLFAQRYDSEVGVVSATVFMSTLAVALSAPLLLVLLPGA